MCGNVGSPIGRGVKPESPSRRFIFILGVIEMHFDALERMKRPVYIEIVVYRCCMNVEYMVRTPVPNGPDPPGDIVLWPDYRYSTAIKGIKMLHHKF